MDKPLRKFTDTAALEEKLAEEITTVLRLAIDTRGHAKLAVSGGRTPRALFGRLSRQKLPWSSVTITLADERCVDPRSEASNERLVRDYLLRANAAEARFLSLNPGGRCDEADMRAVEDQLRETGIPPFDVLVLGMGEDGHTASLFPSAAQIGAAMADDKSRVLMKIQPQSAPHTRMTFTLSSLLASGRIFLHLVGDNKLEVLRQALGGTDELAMPVRAFLHRPEARSEIFWAPA